uniref:THO complex subunit 5B n=1 Tax=Rhizophora mucronata TaxID=61149 RepID=A0A2P2KEJ6_RHIMU
MEDGEIVEGMAMEEDVRLSNEPPKMEKSPYETLGESKASVEEIVAQILSIKKQGNSKSKLRELVTQMFLNLISLRQANRSILLEEDKVKAETEKVKAPVDFTTLQLHNLMYEKSHYFKAIKACRDFKSKYPDIELVPEEEFSRDAPDHIKGPLLSDDSSHNLMLKRLNYELHQRKELCKLQEKLEQRKKSLLETIANRKKFLSSLPYHLKSLKKASLPVQNQLGVLHTKKLKQQTSAELLPPPLYVIYSQLLAQKEAFGENIDLEMVGSLKDARAFARQQANKETGISTDVEPNRLEDDAPDEEDDGQIRRKRPKRAPNKDALDQSGIYQSHPLQIILRVFDDEDSDPKSAKLITLKFEFLLKLNVVCVGVEGSHEGPENNILCNLFPDDTGVELPHESSKLLVGNAFAFDERRTSRPFKWAQHLAGIDFLPDIAPLLSGHETPTVEAAKSELLPGLTMYRQQNRVQTILQRIRSRTTAQLALTEQLDSLGKLKWPSLNCKSVPWALHSPLCYLHSWSPAGPCPSQPSAEPVSDTDQVAKAIDVDMDGRHGISKEESEGAREDGELPSLVPVASVANDFKLQPPSKVSNVEHSRDLALISKIMISPVNKMKSQSFKKYDEDSDLLLDIDSDHDELANVEPDVENAIYFQSSEMAKNLWVDYGAKDYSIVLTRKMDSDEKIVKMEAKIKISMEYPLRPPLLAVRLYSSSKNEDETDSSECYNELRAMEAQVRTGVVGIN